LGVGVELVLKDSKEVRTSFGETFSARLTILKSLTQASSQAKRSRTRIKQHQQPPHKNLILEPRFKSETEDHFILVRIGPQSNYVTKEARN